MSFKSFASALGQGILLAAETSTVRTAIVENPKTASIAANLLSEEKENPEYDRAIVEMFCDLTGLSTSYREAVETALRQSPKGY